MTLKLRGEVEQTAKAVEFEGEYYSQEEVLQAAILMLDGIMNEMISPEVLQLALYRAIDNAKVKGMDEERTKGVMRMLYTHARGVQKRNPMHRAFWG